MYHQVGQFSAPKSHRAGFCHVRRFRSQMRYLKRFGYSVISLRDALSGIFQDTALVPRSVVLTFDDGYQNFYDYAWPILREHRFPATVFLVSHLVGKRAQWLADAGRDAPPMMNTQTLRELRAAGVEFGSHSVNHPRLSMLDTERARAEIRDSKSQLEDVFGERIDDFCYPYGDYDERTRDLVREAGYRSGITCIRGAANTAENIFEIPRKAISYGDNLVGYFWKLHVKHARKDRADVGS
jgi:peptidoglycan/xylan/chitin deacetylase (PgdA/CDA1 family)